jgi:hypothetical protein
MLHHTIEHVPGPLETLRGCVRLLATHGRIVVRAPTVSSEAWRTYREQWVQLDAPRHLSIPSRDGMTSLARRAGLRVESVKDDSTGFQFWGSEQNRLGITLTDPRSLMVGRDRSPFGAGQIREWERRAADLNRRSDGDQVAWSLVPESLT